MGNHLVRGRVLAPFSGIYSSGLIQMVQDVAFVRGTPHCGMSLKPFETLKPATSSSRRGSPLRPLRALMLFQLSSLDPWLMSGPIA